MAKGVLKWLLYLASAGLFILGVVFIFLGAVFIISSNLGPQYFQEGAIFIVVAILFIGVAVLIAYFAREKKPIEIRQTLDISGATKVKEIKCPNCGAILNPNTVQVIDGKPYMACGYCGNKFELTEEPKW